MTPADSKDWWLAVAALGSVVSSTALAADAPQAGVVTAAVASTRGTTNGTSVVLGDQVHAGERFATGPQGLTHILFLDQSSVTLGPNTVLTLDSFSHDSASKTGKIVMTLAQGTVRVVGGLNSKTNPTEINTADGKTEIQGGITVIEKIPTQTNSHYLFGQSMRTSTPDGNSQTVTRQGFGTTMSGSGQTPPSRTRSNEFSQLMGQFENRQSGGGQQTGNTQPGGAPPGQLLSTGDRGSGGQNPGGTLSGDRLSNPDSPSNGPGTSNNRGDSITLNDNTLRNVLDTKPTNQS